MKTLAVHIIDSRGAYVETVILDAMGPQPDMAVHVAPPNPVSGFTRMWTNGEWAQVANGDVPDIGVGIEVLKSRKNDEINAARLAANRSTFTHAGKQFACDELSRSDIDGTNGFVALYGVMPPGWVGGWKAVDNSFYPIATVDDWKAFYTGMFAAGSANFAKAQTLKGQIAAATTPAQVADIHWGA